MTVHSMSEEPKWKERARELELATLRRDLATSKIKIDRLEMALENSDTKIAELESQRYPNGKPFTASEVKPLYCMKPRNCLKSPAPRLKRLPDSLHSPNVSNGSPAPPQTQEGKT